MKRIKGSAKRLLALSMAVCCTFGTLANAASAAPIAEATIKNDAKCSISLYKYDWTNSIKDGVWDDSYVSTGVKDPNVEKALGDTVRKGDQNNAKDNQLGNGQNSNGYAIKGVEFSYLKVADIVTFTESAADGHEGYNMTQVLYGFDKTKAADLLEIIGLENGKNCYANAENSQKLDQDKFYYTSDVLNKAMESALKTNATAAKNTLEAYIKTYIGSDKAVGGQMPLTNEDGFTEVNGLNVGLYLMVETKVPEMVTFTVNPFFVSLPMTSVDGDNADDGGQRWIYDVTLYPKNETGIVTLEKTVREAKKDTATHEGSIDNIADGYKHNATASTGDTVEYQIISTLPSITSKATAISEYTFQDILAKGIAYSDADVKIEWFKDSGCTPINKVDEWKQGDGNFAVTKDKNADGTHTMTIKMTKDGLNIINGDNAAGENGNGKLYAGYSNYTMRITYSATVNADESLVYGDAGNCNEVVLTWGRSSNEYYDTLIDDAHIYAYGINLTKVWSDKSPEDAKADGMYEDVLFTLQNKTDDYYVIAELNEKEGVWYVTGHADAEKDATKMHPVTWNNKDGQLVIKGLEDDEYILTEVATANHYTLLKDSISVVIAAKDDANRPCDIYSDDMVGVIQNDDRYSFDGGHDLRLANIPQAALAHNFLTASAKVDSNQVTMLNDDIDVDSTNALVPLTVTNTSGFDLPQTGENGAKWLPIIGGTILGLAVLTMIVVVYANRKNNTDEPTDS